MEVPLSEVAYLTQGVGPTEIKRVDQQRAVLVTANVYKRGLSAIVKDIESVTGPLKKNSALKDYTIEMAGEQQRLQESFASLAFALVLAFVLVYMIMAAEFESLWQPLLIMFTVPLSLIGVAFCLFFTRTPLSIVSYLGIIMLGGIAVNNGIVLIEFVNARRKEGHTPYQAVIEASTTRLRPILMTSLTTILGLLPLALGFGQGAELQAPLALTVMGGLTSATFLTLVFIPALYLTLADKFERFEPVVAAPQEKIQKAPPQTVLPAAPAPSPIEIALSQKTVPKETLDSIVNRQKQEPGETEEPETAPLPELNVRQKQLIEELAHLKKITRKDYAAKFAVSVPTAARDLKELVDKNLLIPKGPFGPGRWYELVKKTP
jgi:HAE1 family hydrophobic/amphiphilic exporter-1